MEGDLLQPGAVLGERFVVVAKIAAGAQGEVYRAEDRNVRGLVVALKILREPALSTVQRELAMRELELIASVRHPSVVQFLDYGWHLRRLWYAMPWLEGRTLEGACLSLSHAQSVFEKLAAGLTALHAVGIRHQDIKPENVFLSRVDGYEEPMPVLLDLGVAVREGETMAAGSLAYLAPEVARAWPYPNPEVDEKADVFALALTLREILEPGTMPELPEDEEGFRRYLQARATEPVRPPRSSRLRHVRRSFGRWLSLDPEERPAAAELQRELEILTLPARRRKRRLRRGAVAVVMGGLLAFGLHHRSRADVYRTQSQERAEKASLLERAVSTASVAADRFREEAAAHRVQATILGERADDAKARALEAREEAERAAERARLAGLRAGRSREAAERAERLRREAEEAAGRARRAEEESEARAREARVELEAARRAKREAEARAVEALEAQAGLEAELESAQTEQADLRSENRRLGEALEAAEQEKTALAAEADRLARRVSELEGRSTGDADAIADLERELARVRAELDAVRRRAERLEPPSSRRERLRREPRRARDIPPSG